MSKIGLNSVISPNATIGKNVIIGHNCVIEDEVVVGDNTTIDNNVIIRKNAHIGSGSFIGAGCIIAEPPVVLGENVSRIDGDPLVIGEQSLIRSGSIVYSGSNIGNRFQTGHRVTIREKTIIGECVSIGTLSDIQGNCQIGNYVRMHSNVHIGQLSVIDDFVWIFPYVVLTNDPTPPSENFVGVHVCSFAIVATGSVIMPGITIGKDSLVGAGAIVTKDVHEFEVVVGNPSRVISDVRNIKNKITGEPVYPWREHFKKYMPWEEQGFESWYNDLSIEEKEHFKI